jgi:hypothetical protein
MRKIIIALFLVSGSALAEQIDFHIAVGTGDKAWNSAETTVEARIGDVVRIFNDDSVDHQLHTFGAPCGHGPRIAPGTTWDCQVREAFDPDAEGPVYDHGYGSKAAFWIRAVK